MGLDLWWDGRGIIAWEAASMSDLESLAMMCSAMRSRTSSSDARKTEVSRYKTIFFICVLYLRSFVTKGSCQFVKQVEISVESKHLSIRVPALEAH